MNKACVLVFAIKLMIILFIIVYQKSLIAMLGFYCQTLEVTMSAFPICDYSDIFHLLLYFASFQNESMKVE